MTRFISLSTFSVAAVTLALAIHLACPTPQVATQGPPPQPIGCSEHAEVISAVVPGKGRAVCNPGQFVEVHELELDSVLVTCRCEDPLTPSDDEK